MISACQFSVGTSEEELLTVPPGTCGLVISVGGSNTAYIGTGSGVTATNGFEIPGGSQPVSLPVAAAGSPVSLYAIASGASTPVSVLLSTDA